MAWSAKWSWKPQPPGSEPAGARISAGKSGRVERSLPTSAVSLVNRPPVSCIPSPESPANRIVTCSSCSTCFAIRLHGSADHGEPPRLSGGEQFVWIELVPPAEKVALGIVLGRAVDGQALGAPGLAAAALELLEPPLCLLGRRAFGVSLRHRLPPAVRRGRRARCTSERPCRSAGAATPPRAGHRQARRPFRPGLAGRSPPRRRGRSRP